MRIVVIWFLWLWLWLSVKAVLGFDAVISFSFALPWRLGVAAPTDKSCCPYGVLGINETQSLMKPSVFGLGVQKSGTTTLYRYLMKNPLFEPPSQKEQNFFANADSNFTLEKYLKKWPSNREITNTYTKLWSMSQVIRESEEKAEFLFDISPSYLMLPFAACQAKHFFPNGKFIVFLRDPVERTYSSYLYTVNTYRSMSNDTYPSWKAKGFLRTVEEGIWSMKSDPNCDFANGVANKTLTDCIGCLLQWKKQYRVCELRPFVTITDKEGAFECFPFAKELILRSLYAAQLARWFAFFSQRQFFIINSANFFEDPKSVMTSILEFIGASQRHSKAMIKKAVHANKQSYKWHPNKRDLTIGKYLLSKFYTRPNLELYRLLTKMKHPYFVPFEKQYENLELLNCSDHEVHATHLCGEHSQDELMEILTNIFNREKTVEDKEPESIIASQNFSEHQSYVHRGEMVFTENASRWKPKTRIFFSIGFVLLSGVSFLTLYQVWKTRHRSLPTFMQLNLWLPNNTKS